MSIPYTLTDTSVTVLGEDFTPRTMPQTHPAFDAVVEALKSDNDNEVFRLMDLPAAIASFMQGEVQIVDRTLYYKGRPVDTGLTHRILQFMDAGDESLARPLINFLEKVLENPSRRAVMGLYEWCEQSGLPITPEGDILAWKIVREDYMDCHTGTFDNSVGNVVEVERNEVDEDPDRTCSYGLHFCSTAYLPHFGAYDNGRHVMVVKLHPKDVVAFPRDYNTSKGRACRYDVIGEVPPEKAKDFFPNMVSYADFQEARPGSLDDEIELGRYYRTRDGRVVQIVSCDEDTDNDYPFTGEILPSRAEVQTFDAHGNWNLYENHPLDLFEMIDEDVIILDLEVGGRYVTRAGFTAVIETIFPNGAVGLLSTDAGTHVQGWYPDGSARDAADDLVGRLPDEQPKPKGIFSWFRE